LTGAGHYWREWWNVGLPALSDAVTAGGNVSLSTLLLRPFLDGQAHGTPHWARPAIVVMEGGFPLAAYVWTRNRPRAVRGAVVLVATVASAAICWWWRLTLALTIPAALWARARIKDRTPREARL